MREVQVSVSAVSGIGQSEVPLTLLWVMGSGTENRGAVRHPDSGSTFPGRPVREFLILGQSVGTSILPLQSQQEMLTCTWIQIKT